MKGRGETLDALFTASAVTHAGRIAVCCGNEALTYSELSRRADNLAGQMINGGLVPGVSIGICMQRSIDLVVAIIATIKVGGVYVPLDPEYPDARLSFIVADADISLLLTEQVLASKFSSFKGHLLCVDGDPFAAEQLPPLYAPDIDEESPAYIMYTSGSTGTPKGVVIPHRGIVRLVWKSDYLPFGPNLTFLLLSSISFDASTLELWGPLLNGGRCVIFKEAVPTLSQLGKTIAGQCVNVLWLTAALFNTVIDETPEILRGIKYLLAGGEALSLPHVRKALAELPTTRLINGYGPTENTTFTCCHAIPRELPDDISSIPIGRPISGTFVRIFDANMRPVKEKEIGELFIGGAGLALCYLNRPELTAKAFVVDDSSEGEGRLLYRSGDLVRCLEDGTIEFIGRVDNQLKRRGFRVEPGEIESKLAEHSLIRTVAVIARKDLSANTALAAFVTLASSCSLSVAEIRIWLKERLPAYMLPDAIVITDRLPIMDNGKVDRQALAQRPLAVERDKESQLMSPDQALVATILRELLAVDHLGLDDNLLEYGIDSLAIVRLLTRLENAGYGLDFPGFYTRPTIAGIAARMSSSKARSWHAATLRPPKVEAGQPVPLTSVQEAIFFLDRLLPGNPAYRFQAAVHIEGEFTPALLDKSVTAIVARHEILRTTFPEKDGVAQQKVHSPWDMKIPLVDLSGEADVLAACAKAFKECMAMPIHLDRLPLFHHCLLKLGDTHHVFVIIEHHIIHDGGSFANMISELLALYRAGIEGKRPDLPHLSLQYSEHALQERQLLAEKSMRQGQKFWKRYLYHPPRPVALPCDRPRPEVCAFAGAVIKRFLGQDLSEALRTCAREHGVSLFVLMLSTFAFLLFRLSGQTDLVIGTGVANRLNEQVQKMLGMFVNTIPIRARIAQDMSFSAFCRAMHEATGSALQHQGVPFKKILQAVGLGTRHGETPLVSTLFNFHDSRFPDMRLPQAAAAVEYLHNDTAKFDINVIAVPETGYCHHPPDLGDNDGILLLWEYSTELFSERRMRGITEGYVSLLEQIVTEPGQQIDQFPPVCSEEAMHFTNSRDDGSGAASSFTSFTDDSLMGILKSYVLERKEDFSQAVKRLTSAYSGGRVRLDMPFASIKKKTKSVAKKRKIFNMTEQIITELWQELLQVDTVGPDENFFDLGGDSLTALALVSRVHQLTGADLPVSALFSRPTVNGLVQAILLKQTDTASVTLRKEDRGPVLFFFHGDYTGGGLYSRRIVSRLEPGFSVIGMHPQGQPGQPLPQSIETMADRYLKHLRSLQPTGPLFLSGHCNGALVAYEVALQLEAMGEHIGGVFLIDPATPGFHCNVPCTDDAVAKMLGDLTSDEMKSMQMEQRSDLLREVYRLVCGGYVIRPFSGRCGLILGRDSVTVTRKLADDWSGFVPRLQRVLVPGGHHSMVVEYASDLADVLNCVVSEAIADNKQRGLP